MSSRVLLTIFFLAIACDSNLTDDPIPIVPFPNAVVNLVLPEYQALVVDGGYKTISSVSGTSVGVRGIILYRKDQANYFAYEINCSYHPNDASSNVAVHASKLFMTCSGCGSNFSFTDGKPTGGLAWQPLRRYRTELSGVYLTITSDIQQ